VFFPGDTVPAGVPVVNQCGQVFRPSAYEWQAPSWSRGYVEVFGIPLAEEWQAAVDRARAERGEA
jgi:hypothetical protein